MSAESLADNSFSVSRPGCGNAAAVPLLDINNEMVRLSKEAFRRGPTRVGTMFAGPDVLVVVLEDVFTAAAVNVFTLEPGAGHERRPRDSGASV